MSDLITNSHDSNDLPFTMEAQTVLHSNAACLLEKNCQMHQVDCNRTNDVI